VDVTQGNSNETIHHDLLTLCLSSSHTDNIIMCKYLLMVLSEIVLFHMDIYSVYGLDPSFHSIISEHIETFTFLYLFLNNAHTATAVC